MSKQHPVTCGVPQGSILGPLLFLLHFNDVYDVLRKCKIIKYADDTILYFADKDVKHIEKIISDDLLNVAKWLDENQLIINLKKGKIECMLFGTAKRLSVRPENQNSSINTTNSYKYLGVTLDPTLNLLDHLNITYKKTAGRLSLLKRLTKTYYKSIGNYLPINDHTIVYILFYCDLFLQYDL